MLGMLCNFTGNYKRAIPHLQKGMELPPDSRDWWIAADTLVNVYFNQNQPGPARPVLEKLVEDKAKHEFTRALELDPNHADAKAKLAALGD